MKTYCIEETATYYLLAKSKRDAERIFLDSITLPRDSGIHCDVSEREVYPDPENRLAHNERKGYESMATNKEYIKTAKEKYHSEGSIEIDSGATVSRGDDNGAYVQAWVWVYDSEIKKG